MTALLAFAAATLLSTLAVSAYLRLAQHRAWLDEPNHRSSHQRATPSSGGVAIMVVLLPLALVQLLWPGAPWSEAGLAQAGAVAAHALPPSLFAAALLCAIGAWDDRSHLPAKARLVVFLGLCLLVASAWVVPGTDSTSRVWLMTVGLGVALAWLINLYNFMDGTDGLAGLQCVLVALALAGFGAWCAAAPAFIGLALLVAGAYLGFLFFNWAPARLFMGDAGSLSAGLLLGLLGLWAWREAWLPPELWLLLMSPFLIDTAWTLVRRMLQRAPLAEAHREHAYQRLARYWNSHGAVAFALLALHLAWLLPLAWLQLRFPQHAQTILAVGIFPQLFLMVSLQRLQ
ncbi:MAG: glycosyl transferase family 4 [Halieaceae bacterium]|nr:glycosyl transferase family 4 [Halieaceae bacterium]